LSPILDYVLFVSNLNANISIRRRN